LGRVGGNEHRVVVVAQARGGGVSGAVTRDSNDASRLVGRPSVIGRVSATPISDSMTIVGEHDVTASQQFSVTGVSH